MSDDEALRWLKSRVEHAPLEATARELARQWGWPDDDAGRIRVGRRLKRWQDKGLIEREATMNGQRITIGTLNATVNIAIVQPAIPDLVTRQTGVFTRTNADGSGISNRIWPVHPGIHHLGAAALALIALGIAWCGLKVNAAFGESLGRTPEAAALFAALSVAGDAAALVLPTAARALWRAGERATAAVAFGLFGLVMTMALLAAIGFAATNIADTTAARGRTASESASLAAGIARLTAERAAITEIRSIAAIEAEIQSAQPAAAAVWGRTGGCHDVTQAKSLDACAPILRLRQAAGEAARRDAIDAELADKQAMLKALPAITAADPQADAAAAVLNWMSRGMLSVGPGDIAMIRIAGMTLLAQIAGLMFMLAASLWGLRQAGRQAE